MFFWDKLKSIQEELYQSDREVLIYTYKNIGVCCMALGQPGKAEEMYHLALGIVYDLAALPASKEEEFIKEDNEQYSQIYFNLYLAAI